MARLFGDTSTYAVTHSRGLSWDIVAGYWKEGTPSSYYSDWQPLELTEVKVSESRLPKTDSDFFHRTFEVSGSGYKMGWRIDVFIDALRLSDEGCHLSYYVEYVDSTWDLLLDGYAGDTQAGIGSMYCFKLPKYITIAAHSNYQEPTSITAVFVVVKLKTVRAASAAGRKRVVEGQGGEDEVDISRAPSRAEGSFSKK